MLFSVKLIDVHFTINESARKVVQSNCTHVVKSFWLFEGDEIALEDEGIDFSIVDEKPIESYGDLSSAELLEMVSETYAIDKKYLQ